MSFPRTPSFKGDVKIDEPKDRKTMTIPKIPKQEDTAEFKEQAVKRAPAWCATSLVHSGDADY